MLDGSSYKFLATTMVSVAPARSIFSLSAFHGAKAKLDAALGTVLPEHPVFSALNKITYLWSGPGSWLALGADLADLAAAKPFAAITEQTDGRAIFEVTSAQAKAALAKLVPIDLHDDAFPVGATALTLAGHINVQIWREAEDRYALACFRSFSTALYDALTTSCREFES
jgi:sarcosine oxidase subunit gamma